MNEPFPTYTFKHRHGDVTLTGAFDADYYGARGVSLAVAACATDGGVQTVFTGLRDGDGKPGGVIGGMLRFGIALDGSWRADEGDGITGVNSHMIARAGASHAEVAARVMGWVLKGGGHDVFRSLDVQTAKRHDEALDVLRWFVMGLCWDGSAARVLAQRAALGDEAAWEAVAKGMKEKHCDRIPLALGAGSIERALTAAASACHTFTTVGGQKTPDTAAWLDETRREMTAGSRR